MKTYKIKPTYEDIIYGRMFDLVKEESVLLWGLSEKIAIDAMRSALDSGQIKERFTEHDARFARPARSARR